MSGRPAVRGADAAAPHGGRGRARRAWVVALDYFSLALAFSLVALALGRVEALPPLGWSPALAVAAWLGWSFADLGSGVVHFLCDRFGSERTPLLGPAVIRPFREHHLDPRAIAAHGFVELTGNSALALTPMLVLSGELAPFFGGALLPSALFAWLASASAGLLATNQIHRWAHMERVPGFVRWLRRARVAISAEAHARHHHGAHDRAFCITSGWCNDALDRAQVWARAEHWLRRAEQTPRTARPSRARRHAAGSA